MSSGSQSEVAPGQGYITLNVENIDMFVEYLIAPLPAMWTDAEKTREEYF